MEADDQRAAPVTFAGGLLDPYRHVCTFSRWPEEADPALDPFLVDGLTHGDRLLYLVDAAATAAPVNRLRHLGYDAGLLLKQRRCEVRTWTETYLRGGSFDQERVFGLLDGLLLDPTSPRIRLMCDMGWAVNREDVAEELIEFEARANFLHARHEHVVICTYDAAMFDGAFIIDVLRTHPLVLLGGVLHENPFFVDPAEFLEERGRRAVG
ncbi:MEDS domain-containing protein [Agromyces aurantiacus]|uniref:MEDS domain-containing protein n=1 Tax=Agromyces aurantiacus TaxID=165814 RepID=A0ABV9R5J8_9MICO|nr:MEDS domain-containing protein [Agromyces aurantiacus]MBM7503683.1 hypothetical protein [Agromyces aurantiacus]